MLRLRCISAVEPLTFSPGTPVRNAATRSVRGKLVGALTPRRAVEELQNHAGRAFG